MNPKHSNWRVLDKRDAFEDECGGPVELLLKGTLIKL